MKRMSIRAVFSSTARRKAANRNSKVAHFTDGILVNVFHFLMASEEQRDKSVMFDMCLVCRGWLTAARLVLHEHVWAHSLSGARALLKSLKNMPDWCMLVKHLDVPPMWIGKQEGGGWMVVSLNYDPQQSDGRWITKREFDDYLDTMRLVALRCPGLEEIRMAADPKYMSSIPARSPRIDALLDLHRTHQFLRRLELDDGGMHKSALYDIFPESVKFDHLEELTLRNYIFSSPPKYQLFGPSHFQESEIQRRLATMPRLKILRLIHCTSDDVALLPLTRHISKTLVSLTIVQRREKYSCSEEADGDRWHSAFAHNDVFAPLSKRILHLALSMENYGPSYYLSLSSLQALHLRARRFHRASLTDLPSTIRHLSISVIEDKPDWAQFGLAQDHHDFFDDLAYVLSDMSLMNKTPLLRILDINLSSSMRRSALTWIKLYGVFKLCRRGRVFFRVRMEATPHPFGKPLPFHGRVVQAVPKSQPTTPTSAPPSPLKSGIRKRLGLT